MYLAKQESSYTYEIKKSKLLSKYQVPKEIYFMARFKETETGKIQRKNTLALLRFTE